MRLSVLERLLSVDRHRPKLQPEVLTPAPPVMLQYPTTAKEGPWLTSLSKGRFVATKIVGGYVGQAFTERSIDMEDSLLKTFFEDYWDNSCKYLWANRCSTIEQAMATMIAKGLEPKALVVPFSSLREVTGTDLTEEEAERVSLKSGFIVEVDGVKVISAREAMPEGSAILATTQALTGYYTRILDYVGVTVINADRSMVLVKL